MILGKSLRRCAGLCLLLLVLSEAVVPAPQQHKRGKKSAKRGGKRKGGGGKKKGGKKRRKDCDVPHDAPLAAYFSCNAATGNLERVCPNKKPEEPYVYPFPQLFSGIDATTGYSVAFPTDMASAAAGNWTLDASTCKWSNPDVAARFQLSFLDGSLVALKVLAGPSPTVQPTYYLDDGFEMYFYNGRRSGVFDHSGQVYPLDVKRAVKHYDYLRGSCVPSMGGFHYYRLPWTNLSPFVPIYDTLGTGTLVSMLVFTALVQVPGGPRATPGFDGAGTFFASGAFGCDFIWCQELMGECVAHMKNITGGSTEFATGASAAVHLFWDVNPRNPADWRSCAPEGETCLIAPPPALCSCCNTPEEAVAPRSCLPIWPPPY